MKTLSIILYAIGSILLVVSCFISTPSVMWWVGAISVAFLIGGCSAQYQTSKDDYLPHHHK